MNRIQMKNQAKSILGQKLFCTAWPTVVLVIFLGNFVSSIIPGVGMLLLLGPISVGVNSFYLKRIRTNEPFAVGNALDGVRSGIGENILLGIVISVFTFLWSLLLVVPGIVKSYSYSMATYIRVDHPEYGWKECIEESKKMTYGHKMELFILDLSFLGWYIVGALCLGIGTLWVQAYHKTAVALAYESLKAEN
jgi:uncharacterized membrane protein